MLKADHACQLPPAMCLEAKPRERPLLVAIRQGYKMLAEYQLIEQLQQQEQLGGIYAIPSYNSGLHWFGLIFVRSGMYAQSMFRFSILLPDNFPNDNILPTVIFQAAIFHPHICPITHSLDLKPIVANWRSGEKHIWQLLKYIHAVLTDPEGSVGLPAQDLNSMLARHRVHNVDALRLLHKSRSDYKQRVQENVRWSHVHMYDESPTGDPHYITLEAYRRERHELIVQSINNPNWFAPAGTPVTLLSKAKAKGSRAVARIEELHLLETDDEEDELPEKQQQQQQQSAEVAQVKKKQ